MTAGILLLVLPAFAWEHIGTIWAPEDIPVKWYMDDGVEETLPEGYDFEIVQRSYQNWYDAPCAEISDEFQSRGDYGGLNLSDGRNNVAWNDPDNIAGPGVLGVTYPDPSISDGTTGSTGEFYNYMNEGDIIFNDGVNWVTSEDLEVGNCNNQYAIEGVATHEIGHFWGLAHSCEQGETCSDAVLASAVMFWSVGPCDSGQNAITEDDIDSINALYGPYVNFSASADRYGAVPHTVEFFVEQDSDSDATISSVEWNFGDGNTSTEEAPSHTYESAGQFTVSVEVNLSSPTCGDSSYRDSQLGYVLACDVPRPEDGASGFFQMEELDGLEWRALNFTDLSVYGCVDTIAWQVYKGSSESDISEANLVDFGDDGAGDTIGAWAPKFTFPAEGSYVIVMNVGGPGGLVADFLVVDAKEASGGCSTSGMNVAGAGALLLGLGAVFARRRREV